MKKLLALALALAMVLSIGSALADDKVTVTFWYSLSGTNADAIKTIVDLYNESQDKVFVDAQYQGEYDDAINKFGQAFAGGAKPCDILHSYEIGTRFILGTGWVKPVQEFIDKDGWDYNVIEPNLLAYYTVDGKINSMPFNCSTPLLYYNATAFKEAGITVDDVKTIDGVLAAAEKLTTYDAEGKVDRYGLAISNYGWFFEQWVGKMGREYVNNGNGRVDRATAVAFGDNGAALDIFNMWKKFAESPYVMYAERGGTQQGRAAYVAGKAAMCLASTANIAGTILNVGDNFEVGAAYFPYVNADDKGGVSTGGGTLWIIDSGDQAKMDAAYDFIKFCVNPENQAYWSSMTGYFPINVNAKDTEKMQETLSKYPQFQVALDQLHDSGPEYVGSLLSVFPEVRQIVEEVTEKVYNGEITPEQGVDELVSRANDSIEYYNLTN